MMAHLKDSIQGLKAKWIWIISTATFSIGGFFSIANAQISTGIPPLSSPQSAAILLCTILNAMFWILIAVSIIMVLWGAWLYVTAGDDAKKPSEARMTILYAIIGIVVALMAKGFPLVIANIFPGASIKGCGSYESVTTKLAFPSTP